MTGIATCIFTGDTYVVSDACDDGDERLMSLVRAADVAFTNVETLFHNFEYFPMYPNGGTAARAQPDVALSLRRYGISLASMANNHTGDYGPQAMMHSAATLEAAGIAVAGVGVDVEASRRPRSVNLSSRGRLELIAATSTFPEHSRASARSGRVKARPGVNAIRHRTRIVCSPDDFQVIERMLRPILRVGGRAPDAIRFPPFDFMPGCADVTNIHREPHPGDLAAIGGEVREARKRGSFVVVSLHCHEYGTSIDRPPDFLRTCAVMVADLGADLIVCHGAHCLRGLEISNGTPIFYGLGDFFHEPERVTFLPADAFEQFGLPAGSPIDEYWRRRRSVGFSENPDHLSRGESLLLDVDWDGSRITRLVVVPIVLDGRSGGFGRPAIASEERAEQLLRRFQRLSEEFGTQVRIDSAGVEVGI
jgi:hypothetical protein